MLKVAPDPSDKERLLDEVYPGRDILVVEWEQCLSCDREVDAYIYVAGLRRGYCNEHYVGKMTHAYAE